MTYVIKTRMTSCYLDTKNRHFPSIGNDARACADGFSNRAPPRHHPTVEDRFRKCPHRPLPLAQERPLPAEIDTSVDFTQKNPGRAVARFWNAQIRKLKSLATTCQPDEDRWHSRAPKGLRRNQKKPHGALIAQRRNYAGCGGTDRLRQYVFGFPRTGRLPRAAVSPTKAPTAPIPITSDRILVGGEELFRHRAKRHIPFTKEL